ncbi:MULTISPECIES: class Ib ribonucleoside-diphosphate reductase assembly flavoprotein NrdI [Microbacterium]|jgi:protein involved in ribonucleotide reduction|uniref:class Ib ribonucleoside-diphosphate reductase assembly flavoprotein NrdI n=1 Tax=Microbacterium TaxID=33882 RepID=UPI000C5F3BCC|nr:MULTISPECIES: class Ib ribonucleoside-diphosphate reductase assembly flavoprotein NrdI [Microbacterium]MEC8763048.1 class Ib ribonucleoside-diphosphate reductase assembly flavoprotein NrdI [Actinomycetota bacterium]MBU20307.1 class Ib ribonucleoside-diphosphate reductase assembly flavoprotein NrdI [Microbacterium sp.]MCC4266434.1 class Ib ribonucleoside-diphosphate reductase assembly flavoprotein NrdI [Microbacterium schleiferi]HAJ17488.1 class Ib ribonucleoside-diphosphate reductase assembl|tara:strand:- start:608 stop:1045 length:438 start_codon:yes stop_codon:yes gene_type:complete
MSTAIATETPLLVYFSSVSQNTARFIEKLGLRAERIPLFASEPMLLVDEPFVLVTPTYGGGQGRDEERGAVPKQVIRFLNVEQNRTLIRGVIAAGNTNFGDAFCAAGDIISRKCHVPHLYRLELFGTSEDVTRVSEGLERWWKLQ